MNTESKEKFVLCWTDGDDNDGWELFAKKKDALEYARAELNHDHINVYLCKISKELELVWG